MPLTKEDLDLMEKIFPTDPDYQEKRRWIAAELAKDSGDRNLINFHYTPSGPPWASKEAILTEIRKAMDSIKRGDHKELNFNDSYRLNKDRTPCVVPPES